MKAGKIWGDTENIFSNGIVSVHFLNINKGGYCSEHQHAQKANIFFVIRGELEITRWDNGYELIVVLTPTNPTVRVEPGAWHRFRAFTDVKCIEVYDYCYDGIDIERREPGGLNEI